MKKMWGQKRYHSLSYYFKNKFGKKTLKLSLDAGLTCPNRDGKISYNGCIFCSEKGSGDFTFRSYSIKEQIKKMKKIVNKKNKDVKYIAYFQAYSNTYGDVNYLRKIYFEALEQKDIVGISIATRPDCLNDDVLELLDELSLKTHVTIELGLQTIHERTSKIINKGYSLATFEKALNSLKKLNVDVVTHVIFGLPYETKKEMLETIKYLSEKPINGIKIHSLYILKNSKLHKLYKQKKFNILKKDEYIKLVVKSIEILPQNIVIQRLTGDAPKDKLYKPKWSLGKIFILNDIDKLLKQKDSYQGFYL